MPPGRRSEEAGAASESVQDWISRLIEEHLVSGSLGSMAVEEDNSMQHAQTFLRRVSSVSAATVSRWVRLLFIPILAAALFSSLTDFTAPAPDIHAAPMSS